MTEIILVRHGETRFNREEIFRGTVDVALSPHGRAQADALARAGRPVAEGEFDRIVQVPGDGTPMLGWILWHVLEQVIHHRGELFLCLSLLGMDRPAIDRPQ